MMSQTAILTADSVAVHVVIQIALVVRVLLRPHRDPASRIAWVLVVAAMPVLGILAYLLLGEVRLGRRRVQRMRAAMAHLPRLTDAQSADVDDLGHRVPQHYLHLFRIGQSISGFPPIGGNSGCLMHDSDVTIDTMVADIDAARDHVHLLFYIWLPDNNGRKVAAALRRAARRGVACRAMADDRGSRLMIRSEHWRAMGETGVRLARALPIGSPVLRALRGRIDLRNHRKIVVIDDRITYCGSQNCADPDFLVKAKYAPWVDAVIRFEGPIARQSQHLFAADWMAHTREDLTALLLRPVEAAGPGFPAQAFGTGPTVRYSAMPEIFQSLVYSARRELELAIQTQKQRGGDARPRSLIRRRRDSRVRCARRKTRLTVLALADAFPYLADYREPQPTNAVVRRPGPLAAVTIAAFTITIWTR